MVSIFSLPPETLIYVFLVYLHETAEDSVIEEKSDSIELCHACASRPPHWRWLVLVQVCRAWNTTVSSSPLLWSWLYPTVTSHPEIVEKFLSMSCKVPLSVYVEDDSKTVTTASKRIQHSVIRLLQETRLQHFSLKSSRPRFEDSLDSLTTKASFAHLDSLKIRIYGGNLHDRPLEYLSVILQADFRCLHDVKLRDIFPE